MKLRKIMICLLLLLGVLVMGVVSPSDGIPLSWLERYNTYRLGQSQTLTSGSALSTYDVGTAVGLDAFFYPDNGHVADGKVATTNNNNKNVANFAAANAINAAANLAKANANLAKANARLDASSSDLRKADDKFKAAKTKVAAAFNELNAASGAAYNDALNAAKAATAELNAAYGDVIETYEYYYMDRIMYVNRQYDVDKAQEAFNEALKAAKAANADPAAINAAVKASNADPATFDAALNDAKLAAIHASFDVLSQNPIIDDTTDTAAVNSDPNDPANAAANDAFVTTFVYEFNS